MDDRARLEQYLQYPQIQGLEAAIRAGEGTLGPNGYRTMFGGGLFSDFSRHPDRVISSGRYSSAAAGAGQFMPKTWEGVSNALGLTDFSPSSQRLGIAYLADQRLKPIGGLEVVIKEGFTPRVSNLLAPEWASLPTLEGKSYYGQPVKKFDELRRVYDSIAASPSRGQGVDSMPAASSPATPTASSNDPAANILAGFANAQLNLADQATKQQQALQERRQMAQLLKSVVTAGRGGGNALTGFLQGVTDPRMAGESLGLGSSGLAAVASAAMQAPANAIRALMRAAQPSPPPTDTTAQAATSSGSGDVGPGAANGIRSTGGSMGPVYFTSGIGPTSTGPHLDIKPLNRQRFDPKLLDDYIRVNGKPLTSFPVTNTWDDHERRGSYGVDFGTPDGAAVTLINDAQVLSATPTEHGDKLVIRTPRGDFSFLHGRARRAG
jgi:muramidase (phage lysozyme)